MSRLHYFFIAVLLIFFLSLARLVGNPGCAGNLRHDQTLKIGTHVVVVQKADNDAERKKGLSGLDCIGSNEGMLFVFERSGYHSFWMKDTRFAIDIIWLTADKKIVNQQLDVQPSTYPQTFTNNKPAKYVLEMSAGRALELGLSENMPLSF